MKLYGPAWPTYSRRVKNIRGYVCELCGSIGCVLNTAHLVDVRLCHELGAPELIQDDDNVVVLCQPCHSDMDKWLGLMLRGRRAKYHRIPKYHAEFMVLMRQRNRLLRGVLSRAEG